MVEEEERLYTDIPWATAWYGNRTSVLLPQRISDVESLTNGWSGAGGIYLTSETSDHTVQSEEEWRSFFYQKVPEGVPFRHAIELPAGSADQLFLTDRPRWKASD